MFEGGRVRLEATPAGRGAMMAASPCAAGASARRSGEIADLIDLFSKTQYRAKEVTSQVRGDLTVVQHRGGMVTRA